MSSGGARGRSGPAPDPNALRRDRKDDQAGWKTLPSERTGPPPAWPLDPVATEPEQALWLALWRTPQATEWEGSFGQVMEVAIYVRVLAQAQLPAAPVGLLKEARLMAEQLGLSSVGLARYRWRIADAEEPTTAPNAATATKRPARAASSMRDRLRAVPTPPPETEED